MRRPMYYVVRNEAYWTVMQRTEKGADIEVVTCVSRQTARRSAAVLNAGGSLKTPVADLPHPPL